MKYSIITLAVLLSFQANAQEIINGDSSIVVDQHSVKTTSAYPEWGFSTSLEVVPSGVQIIGEDQHDGTSSNFSVTATMLDAHFVSGTAESEYNQSANSLGGNAYDSSTTEFSNYYITPGQISFNSLLSGQLGSGVKITPDNITISTNNLDGSVNQVVTSTTNSSIGYKAAPDYSNGEGGNQTITKGFIADSTGVSLLGDTTVRDNFNVLGTSMLNGINNQNAGFTNAGLISGVTAGEVSATSTEAINGSQLYQISQSVTNAQNTANEALAAVSNVQSDTTAKTEVDPAIVSATTDTTLTTANLTASTAAAQTTASTALTVANLAQIEVSGLDSRVSSLESTVKGISKEIQSVDGTASRGVAIATAIGSIPDVEPGKNFGIGVGVGNYNGKNAFAIAAGARVSDNLRLRLNVGTAGNGKAAVGAGGSYSW